jgi:hypothetical protein
LTKALHARYFLAPVLRRMKGVAMLSVLIGVLIICVVGAICF